MAGGRWGGGGQGCQGSRARVSARENEKVLEMDDGDAHTIGLYLMPLSCTLRTAYFILCVFTAIKKENIKMLFFLKP